MSRFRDWCFTINNPYPDDWHDDPGQWECDYKYLVFQLEAGEEGTPHYQGFIIFNNPKRLSEVKLVHGTAHWEQRMGTHKQAIDYCKKDGRLDGPYEFGERPHQGQGKRNDLDCVKEMIDGGATLAEVAEDVFTLWCRNYRAFEKYYEMKTPHRTGPPEIRVYWGPSGVGKSRRAMEEAGPDAYLKMKTTTTGDWWDGYLHHKHVIVNDFYGWIQHCELLRLLDRYPHQVKVSGGYVKFTATLIIFTSNKHPREWYSDAKLPFIGGPLERRLNEFGRIEYMGPQPEPLVQPGRHPLVDPDWVQPRAQERSS